MGARNRRSQRATLLAFGLVALAAFSSVAQEPSTETSVSVSSWFPGRAQRSVEGVATLQVATPRSVNTPLPGTGESEQVSTMHMKMPSVLTTMSRNRCKPRRRSIGPRKVRVTSMRCFAGLMMHNSYPIIPSSSQHPRHSHRAVSKPYTRGLLQPLRLAPTLKHEPPALIYPTQSPGTWAHRERRAYRAAAPPAVVATSCDHLTTRVGWEGEGEQRLAEGGGAEGEGDQGRRPAPTFSGAGERRGALHPREAVARAHRQFLIFSPLDADPRTSSHPRRTLRRTPCSRTSRSGTTPHSRATRPRRRISASFTPRATTTLCPLTRARRSSSIPSPRTGETRARR